MVKLKSPFDHHHHHHHPTNHCISLSIPNTFLNHHSHTSGTWDQCSTVPSSPCTTLMSYISHWHKPFPTALPLLNSLVQFVCCCSKKEKQKEKHESIRLFTAAHILFLINTAVGLPAPIVERINQHSRGTQCKCIDPLPFVLLAVSTVDDGVLLFQPRTQSHFIFPR